MLMVKFVDQCKEQEKSTSLDENGFTVAKYQLLEVLGSRSRGLEGPINFCVEYV